MNINKANLKKPLLFLVSWLLWPCLALTIGSPSSVADSRSRPFRIVLDPGHGGNDNGAVYGNAREADIALSIAKIVKSEMSHRSDVEVFLTRSTDESLSLAERVEMTETLKADLFISLHANASPDIRAKGVEFYFQNRLATQEESLFLAHLENQFVKESEDSDSDSETSQLTKKSDVLAIIEDLHRQTKMRKSFAASETLLKTWKTSEKRNHKSIRQAPFYVLAKNKVPAVLVEVGFLSNPSEAKKLLDPNFQLKSAQSLSAGIISFKEKMDKGQSSRLQ